MTANMRSKLHVYGYDGSYNPGGGAYTPDVAEDYDVFVSYAETDTAAQPTSQKFTDKS